MYHGKNASSQTRFNNTCNTMSKKKGSQREDFKEEEILQAVVIADSFNVRFAPLTQTKPRTLLPLANVPLLDYTLEFLCSSGIEQVIIFCSAHADQIKEHIRTSKWRQESSPCELITIVSEDCRSLGDALRDIDAKSLIKSDFVLVNGDVVSNLKLKPLIEEHRQRRLKLKTPAMTMIFKRAPPGHRTRCREEEVMLAVSPNTQRLLHYEKVGATKRFQFELGMFQEHPEVTLRYDLLDAHISICSPVVPCLFTDEFDFLTRDDFVRGILVNEEILGNSIHVHMAERDYAARVSNLHMYNAVSKDVMSRWSYPMVPDSNMSHLAENDYTYSRHNIYLHRDVTLARGCVLQENVVVGKDSEVGSNTQISNSVIGKNCAIGENVRIEGAFIWDGCTVGNGCHVMTAVLADNVTLLPNSTLMPGCVLSTGVRVGPDIRLTAGTMLMADPLRSSAGGVIDEFDDLEEDQEEVAAVVDPGLVGTEGLAYRYSMPVDSEDDDDIIQDTWGVAVASEDEDDSASSENGSEEDELEGDLHQSPLLDDVKVFHEEVLVTLERALTENVGFDNMVLEINSLKHAYNIQITEVNAIVTKAVCEVPIRLGSDTDATKYLSNFNSMLKKTIPLLQNYIKSAESQHNCLHALEEVGLTNVLIGGALPSMLNKLYQHDILSEEAILRWNKIVPEGPDALARRSLRKKVEPFIEWLEQAEEESDSDAS